MRIILVLAGCLTVVIGLVLSAKNLLMLIDNPTITVDLSNSVALVLLGLWSVVWACDSMDHRIDAANASRTRRRRTTA